VREGGREVKVLSLMKDGTIEFCYYNLKAWEYPFSAQPFTEEDRARMAARISNHYVAKGWHVAIDRRRFCPRCHEMLTGSECDNWPGGTCDFCGKQVDRSGNIVS
jgi:hypothetical protein